MDSRCCDDIPAAKSKTMRHALPELPSSSKDGEQSGIMERLAASEKTATEKQSGVMSFRRQSSSDQFPRFHIPRKSKEHKALFQYVSSESREFEDIMNILSSNYLETTSKGTFTYSQPRLVHSELLEKDFVERRKELKLDGRTEKELEETYCFLLCDAGKLSWICEKGLFVGQSWITALGNPSKGVYLSKYSDLLQINPFNPGVTGEIIIFKVIKGKVKSIYENMAKNLLDPTPKFDSHFSKNSSKVTSLTSYRAYELSQQFFYEYDFDELKDRPRQVCPYAVVSFQFKTKDAPLQTKPMTTLRSISQSSEGTKERTSYVVWSGDLVHGDTTLYQVCLRSFSPPFLPFKLPERLEVKKVMSLERARQLIPSTLFSRNLYAGSHEVCVTVLKNNTYGSLLEVVEKNKSKGTLAKLLHSLETKRVVLVNTLPDRGLLFLVSSVQMAKPSERGEGWNRCLHALFIYQDCRDVSKHSSKCLASQKPLPSASMPTSLPHLNTFVPALHHSLAKVRCNPPPDLSAGVELQAREYLSGCKEGKVRQYPVTEYDSKLDDRGRLFPAPKHHRLNMEGYLRSYVYSPAKYLLPVAKAQEMVEAFGCLPGNSPNSDKDDSDRLVAELRASGMHDGAHNNPQKVQELIDLVLRCKRRAEGESPGRRGAGRTRRRSSEERDMAERTLKHLRRASLEREGAHRAAEGGQSPSSLSGGVGLKDVDLRRDGSAGAVKLLAMLADLKNAAMTTSAGGPSERAESTEALLFNSIARLDLPTNCDIDLRKRTAADEQQVKKDYLEEQTAGSMSSLEGFSPSSHSEVSRRPSGLGGDQDSLGGDQDGLQDGLEIPWVLIPITGLTSEKYCQREKDNPQDPRFFQVPIATAALQPSSPPPSRAAPGSPEPEEQLNQPAGGSYFTAAPSTHSAPRVELHSQGLEERQVERPEERWVETQKEKKEKRQEETQEERLDTLEVEDQEPRPACDTPPAPASPLHSHRNRKRSGDGREGRTRKRRRRSGHVRTQPEEEREEGEVGPEEEEEEEIKANEMRPPTHSSSCSPSQPPPPPPAGFAGVLDGILEEQHGCFSSEIQRLLQAEYIHYSPPPSPAGPQPSAGLRPLRPLSEYISFYSDPLPLHTYISSLKEGLSRILDAQEVLESHRALVLGPRQHARPRADNLNANTSTRSSGTDLNSDSVPGPSQVCRPVPGSSPTQNLLPDPSPGPSPGPSPSPSPHTHGPDPSWPHPPQFSPSLANPLQAPRGPSPSQACDSPAAPSRPESGPQVDSKENLDGEPMCYSPGSVESEEDSPCQGVGTLQVEALDPELAPELDPGPDPVPRLDSISSLISQLKPEVFSNLVEIIKDVQKNSVQFYIHTVEEENQVYDDIKEYLQRLGNLELSPVSFLGRESSMDKLLVIIHNKDIAAHIHKIPALVSLKRLSSVVFSGVDSLDDIRNHTSNELFVSGGFIVSDEFVLNPDFITHERLRALLMFLEQQSSAESMWRWKVHCKTHRKLKEQARFKKDAQNILSVLNTYQKKQVVEFLPHHDCDMSCRQTPDLACLIRLQAQHVQYRHLIFLTERRFEMFPNYSSSGIVIANIDDIMHNFHNLVGLHRLGNQQPMADISASLQDPEIQCASVCQDMAPLRSVEHSPMSELNLPYSDHHLPLAPQAPACHQALRDQLVPDTETPASSSLPSVSSDGAPTEPDFEALRQAISQFKAERMARTLAGQGLPPAGDDSSASFHINPHQSFLSAEEAASMLKLEQAHQAVSSTLASVHGKLRGRAGAETVSDSDMSLCGSQDSSAFLSPHAARASPTALGPSPTVLGASPTTLGPSPTALGVSSTGLGASPAGGPEGVCEEDTLSTKDSGSYMPDTPQSPEQSISTGNPAPAGPAAGLQEGTRPGEKGEDAPRPRFHNLGGMLPTPAALYPGLEGPSLALSRLTMQQSGLLPPHLVNNIFSSQPLPFPGPGSMIRGLLPSNLPLGWPGLGQTGALWGFQPRGVGQSYPQGLMGNFNAQTNHFRPHRGGFNGL